MTLPRLHCAAVLVAILGASHAAAQSPADKPTGKRTFRMGFTGFVYDITLGGRHRLAQVRPRERRHPRPPHRGRPLGRGAERPAVPEGAARGMGGQEVGDAAEGQGLPRHLARPRRPQARRTRPGRFPKELQGQGVRRPAGDEGVPELLPPGDRVLQARLPGDRHRGRTRSTTPARRRGRRTSPSTSTSTPS